MVKGVRTFHATASVVVLVGAAVAVSACGQVGYLKARKNFKEANVFYTQQEYKKAVEKYEETVADAPTDPDLSQAYFYLGNSYDNMYKPSRKGEPENDKNLTKAIENYKKAIEVVTNPIIKERSLQYLVAAYGPDKLNDPSQAEPLVQDMIKLDPANTAYYFQLAKIHEDAGDYEKAEQALVRAREAKPNDPAVYLQLAGYYNRQEQFDKTIEALEQRAEKEPKNPEAFYTIATYYWDKAYRDFRLKEPEKRKYIQSGLEEVDKAIGLKPDYMEALTYKNLLLRSQALIEKDPKVQATLLKQADQLRDKALELRKKKVAGVGD
jgi:tetratricopeptide (TPR) repeat protein